jgi:hypothetical protein
MLRTLSFSLVPPLLRAALLVLLAALLLVARRRLFLPWPCARWARWVSPRLLRGRSALLLVQRLALSVQRTRCLLRLSYPRRVVRVAVRLLPLTLSSLAVPRRVSGCSRPSWVGLLVATLVMVALVRTVWAFCLG